VIGDVRLFDYLQTVDNPRILDFVETCVIAAVKVKSRFVNADERDNGPRKLLNFGHTMAHGIEKVSGFSVTHGQAVAMGMLAMARASARKGWSNRDCTMPIEQVLRKYGIDPSCVYDAADLAQAALNDKKRSGDNVTIVIPLEIGNAALMDIPVAALEEIFRLGLQG
jgi:3-dehydroquinate synthase